MGRSKNRWRRRHARTGEKGYTAQVVDLFRLYGWRVYHPLPALYPSGRGYATHFLGHVGFPDIVAVHPKQRRVIVAELKARRGRFGKGQAEWLDAFRAIGDPVEVYVWRDGETTLRDIAQVLARVSSSHATINPMPHLSEHDG